jgi:SAM-dependent methyltransferase
MSDIDLYKDSPELYDQLQHSRPDYDEAIHSVVELSVKNMAGKKQVIIDDFCCGTGQITKLIAEKLENVEKANLIDINADFLKIARGAGIKTKKLDTQCKDILEANLTKEADLVLSVFAYHHVPDSEKERYVAQIKRALKKGGVLVFGEIYLPNKEITLKYYEHLLAAIPKVAHLPELSDFLMQTAKSNEFEFKVAKSFAEKQLRDAGLTLLKSKRIWPLDDHFGPDVGTFVEVWGASS